MSLDTGLADVGTKKGPAAPAPWCRVGVLRGVMAFHLACAVLSVLPEAYVKYHFIDTREFLSPVDNPLHGLEAFGLGMLFQVPIGLTLARLAGLRGWAFVRVVVATFGLGFVQWMALLPEVQ